MLEWPPRCPQCGEPIEDWADAGYDGRRWLHKPCWANRWREARERGEELPALRPPTERSRQLEMPMMVSLLLFHFGLGAAIAGWIALTRDAQTAGLITLAFGIVTPVIGAAGILTNFMARRRIELIRQELDAQGGWKLNR